MTRWWLKVLFRKRVYPLAEIGSEKSSESFINLVIRGLGGSLPLAVFIVASQLAAENYDLNLFLALIAAAICVLLTDLCLCEYKFISQSRTSLIYTCYEINGELPSFLIGWSLLLYQMSAVAFSAKTISITVNYISQDCVQKWILHNFGPVPFSQKPPDFVGVTVLILLLTISSATERRKNEKLFRVLTFLLTIFVIVFVSIFGAMHSNAEYILFRDWQIIGVKIFRNASIFTSLFCTSVVLNSHGDCQWKSKLALPTISLLHILITLITCVCIVIILHLVITERSMVSATILFEAFEVDWAKYVMFASIPLCLSMTSLIICQSVCATFRNMASEGLLFRFLNDYSSSKIKWRSYLSVTILVSLAILLTPTHKLIDLMATGYLAISSILLLGVLHQRYVTTEETCHYQPMLTEKLPNIQESRVTSDGEDSSDTDVDAIVEEYKENLDVATVTALDDEMLLQEPTHKTGNRATVCIILLCIAVLPLETLFTSDLWYLRFVGCVLILFGIVVSAVINRQPQVSFNKAKFHVPFFPLTPIVALCLHLTLLMNVMHKNWIWITTWMISGLIIYFGYGIKHSSVYQSNNTIEVRPEEINLRISSTTSFESSAAHNHTDDEDAHVHTELSNCNENDVK